MQDSDETQRGQMNIQKRNSEASIAVNQIIYGSKRLINSIYDKGHLLYYSERKNISIKAGCLK
jgi:hypothetical protein